MFEFLLDDLNQRLNLLCWPGPEDEAVAWIDEVGVSLWAVELCEDFVEDPAWEIWKEDFVFLLLVSGFAVQVVAGLD